MGRRAIETRAAHLHKASRVGAPGLHSRVFLVPRVFKLLSLGKVRACLGLIAHIRINAAACSTPRDIAGPAGLPRTSPQPPWPGRPSSHKRGPARNTPHQIPGPAGSPRTGPRPPRRAAPSSTPLSPTLGQDYGKWDTNDVPQLASREPGPARRGDCAGTGGPATRWPAGSVQAGCQNAAGRPHLREHRPGAARQREHDPPLSTRPSAGGAILVWCAAVGRAEARQTPLSGHACASR